MSSSTKPPRPMAGAAREKIAELRRLTRRVRQLEALHDRRTELFVELDGLGVTQREIADAGDVTPAAVCKAISKHRRR